MRQRMVTWLSVAGLTDVVAIGGSYLDLVCALTGAGALYCWGEDASALLGGVPPGAATAFLDGALLHTAPVQVDPLR